MGEPKKSIYTISLSPTCKLAKHASLGDPQALQDLVERIHERLSRFCYFLTGDVNKGQDLTQEAFIKVLENIENLESPQYFVTWLYQVTRNQFRDYLRRPKNKAALPLEDYQMPVHLDAKMENGIDLNRVIKALTPEERYVFLLVCLEGATYKEAAELLEVTEDSVRSQLFRIRKALREDLD